MVKRLQDSISAREEADQKKAAKAAAKQQRAQTSATGPEKSKTSRMTSGKTSRRKPSTKPHRGKQKAAASPIDISSDSSSYYEITNESEDDLEPPGAGTPVPNPPPPHKPTPGTSTNPSTPPGQRQLSSMPGPSIGGIRRSLRFCR